MTRLEQRAVSALRPCGPNHFDLVLIGQHNRSSVALDCPTARTHAYRRGLGSNATPTRHLHGCWRGEARRNTFSMAGLIRCLVQKRLAIVTLASWSWGPWCRETPRGVLTRRQSLEKVEGSLASACAHLCFCIFSCTRAPVLGEPCIYCFSSGHWRRCRQIENLAPIQFAVSGGLPL